MTDQLQEQARKARELAHEILFSSGAVSNGSRNPGKAKEIIKAALEKCANEARLEALEQAAVKVETMKFAHGDSWHCFMAPSHEAEELAEAIRALKAEHAPEPKG